MEIRNRISKEDRRSQIIESAKKLFIGKGYASTTTAGIAKEADIAEVTLFRYFSSKQELFESIIQSLFNASTSDDVPSDKVYSVEQKIYNLLDSRIQFISEHQGLIKLLLVEHDRLDIEENYIEKMSEHITNQLTSLSVSIDRNYHLRLLMGMLLSFLYLPEKSKEERDTHIRNIIQLLIK